MRVANKKQLTNFYNSTLATSINSESIYLDQMLWLNVQIKVTTADAVGTFTIETSNDELTWDLYPSSAAALSGANKSITWNISDLAARYARLVYTRVGGGGAGTVANVNINVKGINA